MSTLFQFNSLSFEIPPQHVVAAPKVQSRLVTFFCCCDYSRDVTAQQQQQRLLRIYKFKTSRLLGSSPLLNRYHWNYATEDATLPLSNSLYSIKYCKCLIMPIGPSRMAGIVICEDVNQMLNCTLNLSRRIEFPLNVIGSQCANRRVSEFFLVTMRISSLFLVLTL